MARDVFSFSLWERLVYAHEYGRACPMPLPWYMCILKIGRNSSLADEKMMPTLPWSVRGVAAFSIFLFLSCSAINSGECCCLSYFMCHWLPQWRMFTAYIHKASSCLLLHSFPLPHSPYCCRVFSPHLLSMLYPERPGLSHMSQAEGG